MTLKQNDLRDPISLLAWVLFTTLVASGTQSVTFILLQLLVLLILLKGVFRLSIRRVLVRIRWFPVVVIGLMLFHSLSQSGSEIISIGPATMTVEGVLLGIVYSTRMTIAVLALSGFLLIVEPREIAAAFTQIGTKNIVAYSFFLALRAVPLLSEDATRIRNFQRVRRAAEPRSIRVMLYSWRNYLLTLLLGALQRADNSAVAMDLRGFDASGSRTYLERTDFRWRNLALNAPACILVLADVATSYVR